MAKKTKTKTKPKTKIELPNSKREPLTMRETEIVSLIATDMDNKAIGKALKISVETVKEHVGNALHKTKQRSRVGLAIWYVTAKPARR
jgi:DNA-binding NarL/FixJ family response regulator